MGYLTIMIHRQLTEAKIRVLSRADGGTDQLCLTVNRAT